MPNYSSPSVLTDPGLPSTRLQTYGSRYEAGLQPPSQSVSSVLTNQSSLPFPADRLTQQASTSSFSRPLLGQPLPDVQTYRRQAPERHNQQVLGNSSMAPQNFQGPNRGSYSSAPVWQRPHLSGQYPPNSAFPIPNQGTTPIYEPSSGQRSSISAQPSERYRSNSLPYIKIHRGHSSTSTRSLLGPYTNQPV